MTDISELFARDPLQLTDQDLDVIIKVQREARAQYLAGGRGSKSAGSKAKTAPGPKPTLEDLGF